MIGVNSPFDAAFTSAPCAISTFTTAVRPSAAAHISAFCDFVLIHRRHKSAPLRDQKFHLAFTLPLPAQIISAVSPFHRVAFALAPASIRAFTRAPSPFAQASVSGDSP